jgi:hypothetical protein
MTYNSAAWEFSADRHVIKLKGLQNSVLCTIGNFPSRTPVRDTHVAFNIPYEYDYTTKLCRQQSEVIQNHANENDSNIGQGKARLRKYKRLKVTAVMHTTVQMTRLPFYRILLEQGIICCTEPGLTEAFYILCI